MTPLAGALALCVGLALGLLGGGGGILAVPIFVYALGVAPKSAVAMSHAVVGTASLMGFLSHQRRGGANLRAAFVFGAFAMLGAAVGARLARFVPVGMQLGMFSIVALAAGVGMWRNAVRSAPEGAGRPEPRPLAGRRLAMLALGALAIGTLTSIIGVGGGFLIVPVLVMLLGLEMREAIGTSLLVITMNAASALASYAGQVPILWRLVIPFTAVAIVGSLAGSAFAHRVPQRRLKQAFALLVIATALFTLLRRH